jgi:hypothetical protein
VRSGMRGCGAVVCVCLCMAKGVRGLWVVLLFLSIKASLLLRAGAVKCAWFCVHDTVCMTLHGKRGA